MKRSALLVLAAVLSLALPAVAQLPTGTFIFPSLGGLNSPQALWDISGTYAIDQQIEGLGQLRFDVPIIQDLRGKLTGPGTIAVKAGTNNLICTAKIRGSATGASQDFNATITVNLSGTGELLGVSRKFKGALTLTLKLDPNTLHLVGNISGSASASGFGSGSIDNPTAFPLPQGMAGNWSLTLNLQPSGTRIAGDATVLLGNGRTLPFTLTGTFSAKDGQTNLKLNGADAAKGAKLSVVFSGIPPTLNRVSGGVLGVALD